MIDKISTRGVDVFSHTCAGGFVVFQMGFNVYLMDEKLINSLFIYLHSK